MACHICTDRIAEVGGHFCERCNLYHWICKTCRNRYYDGARGSLTYCGEAPPEPGARMSDRHSSSAEQQLDNAKKRRREDELGDSSSFREPFSSAASASQANDEEDIYADLDSLDDLNDIFDAEPSFIAAQPDDVASFDSLFTNRCDWGLFSFDSVTAEEAVAAMQLEICRSGGSWELPTINTVKSPRLDVGVITWNVNHFNTSKVSVPHSKEIEARLKPLRADIKQLNALIKITKDQKALARLRKSKAEKSEARDALLAESLEQRRPVILEKQRKSDAKREMKKKTLVRLFQQHRSWLDIVALQEINASNVTELRNAVADGQRTGIPLQLELGSKMTNINPVDDGSAVNPVANDGDEAPPPTKRRRADHENADSTIKENQQEYYPVIFRTDRADHLGSDAYQGREKGAPANQKFCCWTKDEKIRAEYPYRCRPIIVHKFRLQPDGRVVNVAIVHTSPEGTKLSREGEFTQINGFLEFVRDDARINGGDWIFAGDFYLDPEATVDSNSGSAQRAEEDLFKTRVTAFGLNLITAVSATNQSHLAYKTTETREAALARRTEMQNEIGEQPELIFNNLQVKYQQGFNQLVVKFARGKVNLDEQIVALGEVLQGFTIERILTNFTAAQQSKVKPVLLLVKDYLIDARRVVLHVGLTEPFADKIDSVAVSGGDHLIHAVNKRADFFISTPSFCRREVGIINPAGGLLNVDPNHNALNWWRSISDHTPVGAVFSAYQKSEKLDGLKSDASLFLQNQWEKAQLTLTKMRATALDEIARALMDFDRLLNNFGMTNARNQISDYEALWEYCSYLNLVLKDLRWVSWQYHSDERPLFNSRQSLAGNINELGLMRLLEDYAKKPDDQTDHEKAVGLSAISLVKMTLRSLNTLGYVIADIGLDDESETYNSANPLSFG